METSSHLTHCEQFSTISDHSYIFQLDTEHNLSQSWIRTANDEKWNNQQFIDDLLNNSNTNDNKIVALPWTGNRSQDRNIFCNSYWTIKKESLEFIGKGREIIEENEVKRMNDNKGSANVDSDNLFKEGEISNREDNNICSDRSKSEREDDKENSNNNMSLIDDNNGYQSNNEWNKCQKWTKSFSHESFLQGNEAPRQYDICNNKKNNLQNKKIVISETFSIYAENANDSREKTKTNDVTNYKQAESMTSIKGQLQKRCFMLCNKKQKIINTQLTLRKYPVDDKTNINSLNSYDNTRIFGNNINSQFDNNLNNKSYQKVAQIINNETRRVSKEQEKSDLILNNQNHFHENNTSKSSSSNSWPVINNKNNNLSIANWKNIVKRSSNNEELLNSIWIKSNSNWIIKNNVVLKKDNTVSSQPKKRKSRKLFCDLKSKNAKCNLNSNVKKESKALHMPRLIKSGNNKVQLSQKMQLKNFPNIWNKKESQRMNDLHKGNRSNLSKSAKNKENSSLIRETNQIMAPRNCIGWYKQKNNLDYDSQTWKRKTLLNSNNNVRSKSNTIRKKKCNYSNYSGTSETNNKINDQSQAIHDETTEERFVSNKIDYIHLLCNPWMYDDYFEYSKKTIFTKKEKVHNPLRNGRSYSHNRNKKHHGAIDKCDSCQEMNNLKYKINNSSKSNPLNFLHSKKHSVFSEKTITTLKSATRPLNTKSTPNLFSDRLTSPSNIAITNDALNNNQLTPFLFE